MVGAVSIRSRGMYFILMTLAFGQLGYHFFHDTGVGGSADGAYVNFRPELHLPWQDISFDSAASFYRLVSIVVLVVIALCWWLRRSAFGSILIAARDNEQRTRAFGYSPYALRLIAFIISGAMAGAMGYLTAAKHGFVAPQMLAWHASAIALVMVLIGGKDTTSGPAIGAIILLLAEEMLQRWTEHWLFGVGLIIVVVVIAAPEWHRSLCRAPVRARGGLVMSDTVLKASGIVKRFGGLVAVDSVDFDLHRNPKSMP